MWKDELLSFAERFQHPAGGSPAHDEFASSLAGCAAAQDGLLLRIQN